ncbi:MAG: universal stress protein [Thaumarchaeota archaeon]|nr:MAG: universal stress protein [Nitrososphaerota archaeon]TLX90109.1 MAG: universal stress protein [Nitrososphaerota archaeon]
MKQKTSPKILVAIDESEYSRRAFQYACMIALNKELPLQIVNVIEEHATVGRSILRELENSSKQILHKYQARAKLLGVASVSTVQSKGNPAEEILKIANIKNIDTVVVGSRGRYTTSKDILLGSNSYKLVHYSKCTVIVVR